MNANNVASGVVYFQNKISERIPIDSLTNYECLNIAELHNILGNKNKALYYLELVFQKDSLFKDIWNFSKTNSQSLFLYLF
jgi:hypothetical protein